jgi:CheY-like chemotaxis protein
MKKTILIAEDEIELLTLYNRILKDLYTVINAQNGREAIDLFKKHKPDLTLMDIRMPVMSGDEAIKEIQKMDSGAKIIAVTAFDYSMDQLGVPVMRKGFTKQDFLSMIEKGLLGIFQ